MFTTKRVFLYFNNLGVGFVPLTSLYSSLSGISSDKRFPHHVIGTQSTTTTHRGRGFGRFPIVFAAHRRRHRLARLSDV